MVGIRPFVAGWIEERRRSRGQVKRLAWSRGD
jgi:hypothetical protein